jgi:hypothetical protein
MGMVLQWAREYNIRIEWKRRKPQKEKKGELKKTWLCGRCYVTVTFAS